MFSSATLPLCPRTGLACGHLKRILWHGFSWSGISTVEKKPLPGPPPHLQGSPDKFFPMMPKMAYVAGFGIIFSGVSHRSLGGKKQLRLPADNCWSITLSLLMYSDALGGEAAPPPQNPVKRTNVAHTNTHLMSGWPLDEPGHWKRGWRQSK